tara:strand:+ start:10763 stop:13711 length:2949 start_codon:yes stop_codon:yes gene_type:complete
MINYSVVGAEIPTVNTKKIILHDNNPFKIEIDYKLSIQNPRDYDYTKKNLYFLILTEDQISKIVTPLRNKNTRTKMLTEIFNNNILNLYSNKAACYYTLEDLYSDSNNKIFNNRNIQEFHNSVILEYDLSRAKKRKLDYTSQSFNYSFEILDTPRLHLVCFVDNSIDNLNLPPLMGDINYDLLLEESKNAQGIISSTPPKYRKSFFVDDIDFPSVHLRPYNGPAHYHSKSNPSPAGYRDSQISPRSPKRGYVGWMAGHEKGGMGPKLRVTESLNEKIQILGSLKKTLKAKIQNNANIEKKNNPILEKHSSQTAYTRVLQESERSSNISDESHYGCVIGLNILNALKKKSVFAKYVEVHHKNNNQDILFSIIKRSKILNLSVIRRRIENGGASKNGRSPKKINRFSKNDKQISLINTADKRNRNNQLQTVRNNRALLHQISLSQPTFNLQVQNPYYTRMININDYDLFHNVKVGNYTYDIVFTMKDGTISYFKSLMKKLVVATMRMKKYQQICMEPAVYDSRQKLTSGSYDYQRKESVGSFARDVKYNSFLNRVTLLYADVCKFLSGSNLNQEEVNNIRSCIMPKTLNIDFLQTFILQLESVTKTVKEILSSVSDIVVTPPEGNRKKTSRYGDRMPHIPASLDFRIKTNININAENKNHICTDHNIVSLKSKNILSLSDINSSLASFYIDVNFKEPRSFVKIRTSPYKVERKKAYKISIKDSARAYKNHISKHNEQITKGNVEIMMERGEFYSSNYGTQSNFETKILALKQPGAALMGIDNKPESYYPAFLQGRSNSFVLTVSGFSDNFVYPDSEISQLRELVYNTRPDATDELIKSLHETLVSKSDPEEIEQIIEEKYHSLIKIKQRLGRLYSRMNLAFNLRKRFVKNNNKQKYKELYINGKTTESSAAGPIEEEKSVFSLEKACLYSIVPGVGKIKINPRDLIQMSNNLKKGGNQYLFIKVEHQDKNFKLPLVNDGFLIEI